jgi:hypothetical protein
MMRRAKKGRVKIITLVNYGILGFSNNGKKWMETQKANSKLKTLETTKRPVAKFITHTNDCENRWIYKCD